MNEVGVLYDKLLTLLFANRSYAIHYGFWGKWVFTFAGAQQNENRFLAEAAAIESGERILDAGCGIGGSALWLARERNARVTGIALGEKEIRRANTLAKQKHLSRSLDFRIMDLCRTTFPRDMFDVVWAIESVLYVNKKKEMLGEWARIIRPRGRVVIADLFLGKEPGTEKERRLHADFSAHSLTSPLIRVDEMTRLLADNGFTDIHYIDKRISVLPTSLFYWLNSAVLFPFAFVINKLSFGYFPRWFYDYMLMAMEQWSAMRTGLFTYGVFVATKT